VLQEVAQILSLSVERIDPERPLHDLGMDSLMAVELALGLEKRFGRRVKVSTRVEPDLIGGARITVGDVVIDGSVAGQLAKMASALKS
ncbi:MAG: F0F1 ATP synthase subunit delta, partial [Burkholderiales bacterium]